MIFFIVLCILIICLIYCFCNSPIKENLVTTPAVVSEDYVNQQSDYIDSKYLNEYSTKIENIRNQLTTLRSNLNNKTLSDFIKFNCKYKTPSSTDLIGVQNNSEIFNVSVSSDDVLSNTINMEVPVGQKGAPGPPGDPGKKGETGDIGPTGKTGNCGNVSV